MSASLLYTLRSVSEAHIGCNWAALPGPLQSLPLTVLAEGSWLPSNSAGQPSFTLCSLFLVRMKALRLPYGIVSIGVSFVSRRIENCGCGVSCRSIYNQHEGIKHIPLVCIWFFLCLLYLGSFLHTSWVLYRGLRFLCENRVRSLPRQTRAICSSLSEFLARFSRLSLQGSAWFLCRRCLKNTVSLLRERKLE